MLDELPRWRQSSCFSQLERAVLAFVEGTTRTDADVDDATFAALRAHLDEAQVVELAAWIGLQGLYSSINRALDVEAQGLCPAPGAG